MTPPTSLEAVPAAHGPSPLHGMRALLVGRPSVTRSTLRGVLRELGADDVDEVASADDAVMAMQLMPAHLVVSDTRLEGDRDGDHLLEELRLRELLPPVSMFALVTADRSQRRLASYVELGPDLCFVKPIDPHEVARRLGRLAQRRRLMRELYAALDVDDVDAAVVAAQRIAQAHPGLRADAGRLAVDRLVGASRLEDAQRLIESLGVHDEPPWAMLRLARIHYAKGRLADAHGVLERLMPRAPDLLAAYDLMALVKEQLEGPEPALACLDAAGGRSLFNVKRLRLAGELAMRAGDLARAEREFGRVMDRLRASNLQASGDYGNLVNVLVARGKLDSAALVQAEQGKRLGDSADAMLTEPMVAVGRAARARDPHALAAGVQALIDALETQGAHATPSVQLAALEAVFAHGRHDAGFRLAQRLIRSLRADRAALHRIRALIDRRRLEEAVA